MTTTRTTASDERLLMIHVAALRRIVLRYRFSRGHTRCGPTDGVVSIDARCVICRLADDVLAEPTR